MADGASSNDTMATMLSQLINHFKQADRGRCLNHVLHLAALRIINPFEAKPGQLDRALAEMARKLEVIGEDLTSLRDADDDEEEVGEERAEREEEEERHFRDIAVELAAELSVDERANLATSCLPGATALTKVHCPAVYGFACANAVHLLAQLFAGLPFSLAPSHDRSFAPFDHVIAQLHVRSLPSHVHFP